MNSIQEAFLLVQSLNRGERKRVSQYLEQDSNQFKLFTKLKKTDLVEAELDWKTTYDKNDTAGLLIRKIAESMLSFGYAQTRQISNQDKKRKRRQVIQWCIMDARFYYERNIFRLCKKYLLDAEKEAIKIYAYTDLLTIYNLLLDLTIRVAGNRLSIDIDEQELLNKIKDCLAAIEEYTQFRGLNIQLYHKIKQGLGTVDKEVIIAHFQKQLIHPPKSALALQRFYQAKGLYYLLINQPQEALLYNTKAKDWWEQSENEVYKNEEKYQYLLILNNNAQSCIAIIHSRLTEGDNLYFQYQGVLEKILSKIHSDCKELRKDEEIKIKAAYYKNRINQLILSKQSHKAEQLIEGELWKAEKIFDKFNVKDKIVLLCQYAAVCFRLKKYEKSYQQIIQCYQFSGEDTSIRKDLIQHLYLLEATIYSIFKEMEEQKIKHYFKGKCPIIRNLEILKKDSKASYLIKGLELLLLFDNCLPSERKKKFRPFAEHICQHINRPFAMDIISWLKQYPLSSGLTQVTAVRI